MIIIFLRAIILYVALLLVMRLMGKRQIGEMQPFEFVITLLIAELACIPMTDVSIPLTYGLVSVLAIFILHQIMSILERCGNKVKFLISGAPSLVITPNGVDLKELKRNNMGVEDLIEAMRSLGYFCLDDLKYAIFESNGKLSALEREKINEKSEMPVLIINDGKFVKTNLQKLQIDQNKICDLFFNGKKNIANVQILTLDKNGRAYLQKRGQSYKILSSEFYFTGDLKND